MILTWRVLPVLAALPACVGPATYGTARPVAEDALATHVTMEACGDGSVVLRPDLASDDAALPYATLPGPGVGLRWGIEPRADMGLRLSGATGLEVDGRWLALDASPLVVALSPAIVIGPPQAMARALVDVEATSWLTLGLRGTAGVLVDDERFERTWGGGLSVLLRPAKGFGLQPSIAATWRSDRRAWSPSVVMGLGFLFGGLP